MSQKPFISIRHLSKSFGRNQVLKDLNLDIYKGESLVIIGGSGTGKSVLIKCIIGLIEPDKGEIIVDGKDVLKGGRRARQEWMQRISMLFQGSALFDSLKVWENVAFALLQNSSIDREEAKVQAIKTLASVGMKEDVADLYPAELSGGMKRRVALARAIIEEPEIIFFDEPTTGLDPIIATVIDDLIIKSVREIGATALTITHDMNSARRIADRIAMIYGGKIIWEGPADKVNHSGNPYVDQFVHGKASGPIDVVRA